MASKPQIVLVVGMHRSGTSLATEMLVRLGAHTRKRLLGPSEFNPRGYWEDLDLVDLHDRILMALDRPWGGWRASLPLPREWHELPEVAPLRDSLARFIGAEVEAASSPWVIKDPRICRLLPLWLAVADDLGLRMAAVLSVRSPNAVAASLEKRDLLPLSFGRFLWLANYLDALTDGRSIIRGCVSYESWFTEGARQAAVLASIAGIDKPQSELKAIAADIVSDTLRHHSSDAGNAMSDRLYAKLDAWAATEQRPEDLDALLDLTNEALSDATAWIESTNSPEFLREALEAKVEEFRAAYQSSSSKYNELRAQLEEVSAQRNEFRSLVWRLERPLRGFRSLRRLIIRSEREIEGAGRAPE